MDFLSPGTNAAIQGVLEQIYSLEKYAAPTVVLVPSFVKAWTAQLAAAVGFDVEALEYVLGLFLCYPLGLIMLAIPYGKIKHIFSFLLGVFLLQFTIGAEWVHVLIASVHCYLMFLLLPRSWNKWLVPLYMMTYMSLGHIHRQYTNYLGYDMDFTGAHMVLVMKLYSMAYNLYDGEQLARGTADKASKKCEKFALKELPDIVEYLGYTFCFANVLAGPAYEFKTYQDACNGSLLYTPDGKPRGKIPSVVWPSLRPFLMSLVCMGAFVVGSAQFPLLNPADPQRELPVILSPELMSMPWFQRYAYMWVSLFFIRQKYYFAWKTAEGANNIWYAGFEGFDEKGNAKGWDNSSNTEIWGFETAPNLKMLSAAWNKKTAYWLSRYVYIRTNGSLLATYGTSAFWHGFYPGYYMFFLSVPLMTACERIGRKKVSPIFSTGGKWSPYGIVTMICTSLLANYFVASFQLLAFEWSIACWKSLYFIGHIACIVFYAVCSFLPTPKKKTA